MEFERQWQCFLMSGFKDWIPMALMISVQAGGQTKPEDILRSMVSLWIRPSLSEDDEVQQQQMVARALSR